MDLGRARFRFLGSLSASLAVAIAMWLVAPALPAAADHGTATEVAGSALGYHAYDVALFGGPQDETGPAPTVTLAADASNSPQEASQAEGNVAYGPAQLFSSGEITVATEGSLGEDGYVTSTVEVDNVNRGGSEVFDADNLQSTCTVTADGVSASTTVLNGVLRTHAQGEQADPPHDEAPVAIPTNPEPNHAVEGHLHIGATATDSFEYVFNEQIHNGDGSITVNALHIYLIGPTATGHLIVGQSVCGPISTDQTDHEPGAVAGTVSDADSGDPIVGATATAGGQSTTTAADGTYLIEGVDAGARTVTVTADGYASASQEATVEEGETTTVDFALLAAEAGTIEGTVTEVGTGAAIVGATVTATRGAETTTATTQADGSYSISDLAPGQHILTAAAAGYAQARATVTVTEGETTQRSFTLQPVGRVTGTVTDADTGEPVAGATVSAGDASTTTGADGAYGIANLNVGSVTVTASADGYADGTQTVTVSRGQTTTADFALSPAPSETGAIAGSVTDADTEQPLPGIVVTVTGADDAEVTATTDGEGSYQADGLEAGDYTVSANAAEYETASQDVTVEPGGTSVVDLALERGLDATEPPPAVEPMCATGVPSAPFVDRESIPEVHRGGVDCTTMLDIVRGFPDQTYGSGLQVRRDQMASFILRSLEAAGVELPPATGDRFGDVAAGNAHDQAIHRLAAAGIAVGGPGHLPASSYGPSLKVRRDQMASFLIRAAEYATEQRLSSLHQSFIDVTPDNPHFTNVNGAAQAGVAQGYGGGIYRPEESVLRGQMSSFIVRLLAALTGQD